MTPEIETLRTDHASVLVGAPRERLAVAPVALPMPLRSRPRVSLAARLLEAPGLCVLQPVVDAMALAVAVVVAVAWTEMSLNGAAAPLLAFPPLALGALFARHTYQRRMRTVMLDAVGPIVGAISVATMAVVVLDIVLSASVNETNVWAYTWMLAVALVGTSRGTVALAQRQARLRGIGARPTLIVGAGQVGARVARRLVDSPEYGMRPVGFLDEDPPVAVEVGGRPAPVLGSPDDLARVVVDTGARHVVLAFSNAPDLELLPLVRRCEAMGLDVSLVPRLFESMNDRVAYDPLGGLPLLGLRRTNPRSWQFTVKHACDRVGAATLLVAAAPILALLALAVRLSSPGPVLFRQVRVGRDGQVFDLLKFRTMRVAGDDGGFAPGAGQAPGGIEGVDRRTPIGRFLRRSSLDELPQLVNVLRGEMSLVGPRPERPQFVELFSADLSRYADRHRVRSGITGWAQVHGLRGQTSLADRVELDNFYIEHWSLALDAKILLRTVLAVFQAAE